MSKKSRGKLIILLKNITPKMKSKLEEMKKEGRKDSKRGDLIWHLLLQSFSTWRNSRGHDGLIKDRANYNKVRFETLNSLGSSKRFNQLRSTLREAKVIMSERKAQLLNYNFQIIKKMGGLKKAKEKAFAMEGRENKINFMKQFHGIGNKYGRNVWMDIYHPDFHESIAIDERIKRVTKILGYSFSSYTEHERFYLDIAHEAGLQGWELDRLLYNFLEYFIDGLSKGRSVTKLHPKRIIVKRSGGKMKIEKQRPDRENKFEKDREYYEKKDLSRMKEIKEIINYDLRQDYNDMPKPITVSALDGSPIRRGLPGKQALS